MGGKLCRHTLFSTFWQLSVYFLKIKTRMSCNVHVRAQESPNNVLCPFFLFRTVRPSLADNIVFIRPHLGLEPPPLSEEEKVEEALEDGGASRELKKIYNPSALFPGKKEMFFSDE